MKTFLIISERPKLPDGDDDTVTWRTFLADASKNIPLSKSATKLPEGTWQMPIDAKLGEALRLLQLAAKHGISFQIALLDEPTAWIKYP